MITVSKALLGKAECPGTCREFQWGGEEDTSVWQRQSPPQEDVWEDVGISGALVKRETRSKEQSKLKT